MEKQESKVWVIAATIFVLLGAGLVVVSVVLETKKYAVASAVALNLGLATLALVLIDSIWRLVGGNPLDARIEALDKQVRELAATTRLIEGARVVGLENIWLRQGDFGKQSEWESLIREAHHHVDVMARSAFGWTKSRLLKAIVTDRIHRSRVTFRWLLMSRSNRHLALLAEEDGHTSSLLDGKLHAMEDMLCDIRRSLPVEDRKFFQIRTFDHVPLYFSTIRVDDRWLVTQYLFSRSSDECPLTSLRGEDSAWASMYAEEFNFIWKSAEELACDDVQASMITTTTRSSA